MGLGEVIGTAAAQTGLDILSTKLAQDRQKKHNLELAKYQNQANQKYLQQQLEYDSPVNQMRRFQEAGLNPNLIYDKGTGGNQGSPLSFPEIKPTDMSYGQLGSNFMDAILKGKQAELMETQKDLNRVKVDSETVNQDLKKVQRDVLSRNPYLDPEYLNAVVVNMKAIAQMKEGEASAKLRTLKLNNGRVTNTSFADGYEPNSYEVEVVSRINQIVQKFNLNEVDQKIKGEILQSKEFQNELQKIEVDWMKEGEITPQHIFKGIMMLLQKLM